MRYLNIAQQINPRDEQAAPALAQAEEALHDDAGAVRWCFRATGIKPEDPDAWYGLVS